MALLRSFRPLTALPALIVLAGCPAAAPQSPTLPVIDRGTGTTVQPAMEPPDEALLGLARTGRDVSNAIGPALRAFAPLLEGIREARRKHPPQAYRLAQVSGWRFQGGAWTNIDGERRLRAVIEDVEGRPPAWDVTAEANYGPDFHPAFPAGLVRARLDVEQTLASGGRMALGFSAPLGEAGEVLEAVGTGSVAVLGATGAIAVEALNARLGSDATVERGELVLKSQGTGVTLQFSGTFALAGLQAATMLRSATPAGTLVQTGGTWQFKNEAGTYPL